MPLGELSEIFSAPIRFFSPILLRDLERVCGLVLLEEISVSFTASVSVFLTPLFQFWSSGTHRYTERCYLKRFLSMHFCFLIPYLSRGWENMRGRIHVKGTSIREETTPAVSRCFPFSIDLLLPLFFSATMQQLATAFCSGNRFLFGVGLVWNLFKPFYFYDTYIMICVTR